ncbi:hypothetical protein Tco_1142134 [Tanacetum coccineum]
MGDMVLSNDDVALILVEVAFFVDDVAFKLHEVALFYPGTFDGILTGKKHVEVEFGENKNIICWISTKVETKERAISVLNNKLMGSYNNDIIKVLRIAMQYNSLST